MDAAQYVKYKIYVIKVVYVTDGLNPLLMDNAQHYAEMESNKENNNAMMETLRVMTDAVRFVKFKHYVIKLVHVVDGLIHS